MDDTGLIFLLGTMWVGKFLEQAWHALMFKL